MIITKMALPRRTFLRGMGATVALPLLDAMVPALSALAKTAAEPGPPPRVRLRAERRDDEPRGRRRARGRCSTSCRRRSARSAPFRDQVRRADRPEPAAGRVAGRRQRRALARPDGVADAASIRSGPKAPTSQAGTTVDQIAAQVLGKDTPLLSLEMALEQNYLVGNCDNGYSCVYWNTISWRTPTTPLPMEVNPRVVFERLFGDGGTPGAAAGADARGPQHPRFGQGSGVRPAEPARRGRPRQGRRVPRRGARDRAAHPGRREAERRVADRAARPPGRRARERTTSTPS